MAQELHYVYTDPDMVDFGTQKKTQAQCSPSTLKGTYTVAGNGTDVFAPIAGLPAPPFPMAHVAILAADGLGHISGSGRENVDGLSVSDTFTASYTVSRECAVTVMIADTSTGSPTTPVPEVGVISG